MEWAVLPSLTPWNGTSPVRMAGVLIYDSQPEQEQWCPETMQIFSVLVLALLIVTVKKPETLDAGCGRH